MTTLDDLLEGAAEEEPEPERSGGGSDTLGLAATSIHPVTAGVQEELMAFLLARGASLEEAQRILMDEIAPIDDIRSTAEYRRRVAANLLARLLDRP